MPDLDDFVSDCLDLLDLLDQFAHHQTLYCVEVGADSFYAWREP